MTEQQITEEELLRQFNLFNEKTVPAILQLLEDEQYHIAICCQGLVTIIRALIQHFGNEELRNECIHYLQQNIEDIETLEK
jgi:hypothetical protein